ncbi:phosphoribosylformylglycinamidine synthase subunit PurL [Tunturibacter empetritectus]|uniref:Phosphoribosylformylglycinamidine synthase subunit PurL n=1 Tax=Tunturiibacter empetritectus TaxID=3069691 RepID=A0A7W8IKE4_9BACT|nr:phosphoribosylformylglycinamidine synthase subunit PurL [Edaphobacter lichenicola]MBB5318804.1 phosphoribosylformylglycinamidine synthase [Edaphobacter lichenicola]
MPNLQAQQDKAPSPATITPALLKQHSITPEEYTRLEAALGRTPSLTELGIFSVMWSEHCSYKSSRVHLKRLPTRGERKTGPGSVVQGPGENAGIIDVGDGWACAFKIESHNHPSYIEPYQGAATGVGGILRDIFTMNARPLAVMDSLRFGPLDEAEPDEALRRRNHQIATGVVHGVAGYGNCFGVPNVGGETRFEACYSGNPLLNAFALGLVRSDEIFYAKATGVGNPVIYVGAKTGRDGIHGATMASEEFTEGSEQKRPNVQMGDPFLEKLLLEACLEAMATGAVLGIQDMGAAGLTCSTCEMGARGDLGLTVELDLVPQRETGMSSYEIMLSESQERMLLVADKPRAQEVLDVFAKWGLDASIVGVVTEKPNMVITQHGELMADIPNRSLTDDAPLYHRPVGVWKAPVPLDPPAHVLEELKKPSDYAADLKKLLASANICDKRWVFEQYDSMVQTNTVQGPGGEAGVIRIKGTGKSAGAAHHQGLLGKLADLVASSTPKGEATLATDNQDAANPVVAPNASHEFSETVKGDRGLAMALAGNGRWTYLDPKLGATHAVAEAARKVACTGAMPVSATNCLNFGNPEKPEIMAQLSQAIDGIAEACIALGTPVTGGNVSLYNETRGEGIYPTPVLGIVGIIDDVTKAVPSAFRKAGDVILFLSAFQGEGRNIEREFGSTEYAKTVMHELWGAPPLLDLTEEAALHRALAALSAKGLLASATDISDGGAAVAFAKACFPRELGVRVSMNVSESEPFALKERFFSEIGSSVIVSADPERVEAIRTELAAHPKMWMASLGEVTAGNYECVINGKKVIDEPIAALKGSWTGALEEQLAAEVVTA